MIDIDKVSKWYGSFQVLTDCTTRINKGEVVVVCGPSGSGKSTLIKTVNALEPIQQGDIRVDGQSITAKGTNLPQLRSRVGMVFQHFELFPHLSVSENLTLAQIKVLKRSKDLDSAVAIRDAIASLENVEGVTGKTAVHICFGYAAIIHARPEGYSFLTELSGCSCHQISIETAQSKRRPVMGPERSDRTRSTIEAWTWVVSSSCGRKAALNSAVTSSRYSTRPGDWASMTCTSVRCTKEASATRRSARPALRTARSGRARVGHPAVARSDT